jgi:lipid A 3-O-deacylase
MLSRILVVFLIFSLAFSAHAEEDNKWTYSAAWENDFIVSDQDKHYTNGAKISALSPKNGIPQPVKDIFDMIPFFDSQAAKFVNFSIGQNMFTPEDLTQKTLIHDDRPYAGWLYGSIGLIADTGDTQEFMELNIGVVGPSSLAGETQEFVHNSLEMQHPEGWSNQLKDEPAFLLGFEKRWKNQANFRAYGFAADITPKAGVALGNVYTYGSTGFILRFGQNLPQDYGPPKIRPSMPGSEFFISQDKFGWYAFADVEARGVGWDIFLDGNTYQDSHSVDKKHFVGELQGGLVFSFRDYRISYTHVLRTEEFEGQDDYANFGNVSVSLKF